MFSYLKNHPFAVEAFFKSSSVLTFAVPKEQLQDLIPECLALDTFNDTWAFVALAMVDTKKLRPKGFPKCIGNDFFLIGYRVFVKYVNTKGKRLRGLYILKSETNKNRMTFLGNIFTHYNYTKTDIKENHTNNETEIKSIKSDFRIVFKNEDKKVLLPKNSPFSEWKEARRFAGPLPFTFSYHSNTKKVLIIEGVRQYWKPKPVEVIHYNISFLKNTPFKNAVLANAFMVKNIPYYWKKGKTEPWNN